MGSRILILAETTGYQTRLFEQTARRMGLDVVLGTDRCHHMKDPWGDGAVAVRFHQAAQEVESISRLDPRPDGVIAVGDRPAELAARVAERLGLRFHPPAAVEACGNKFLARECFRRAGMLVPEYFRTSWNCDVAEAGRCAQYPCVLKPLGLSASRGVIRANDQFEFADAFRRITAILSRHEIARLGEAEDRYIQVEDYIPGREFALEGLVIEGRLKTLALFDKPDPLEGPFFEETIYVTPSREPAGVQLALRRGVQEAVTALGMTNGPVHAEMRYNDEGVWMIEVAARPIGGLCSGALRFEGGKSLEELLLRFAVGEEVGDIEREAAASGVMMIPIPKSGVYQGVAGVEQAAAVDGIESVEITAKQGQRLLKLPEGASYLGFLFARGASPESAERALREAHARLEFEIMGELPALNNAGPNY